jgi:hypothetical protein
VSHLNVRQNFTSHLSKWIARYGPPEIVGTLTALAGAGLVLRLTHSLAAAAVAGSLAEAIGFYGYAGGREAVVQYRRHAGHQRFKRYWLTAGVAIRDLFIEFGPGELLDSLAIRPAAMYLFPLLLHDIALGILAGKLAADVVFYASAAVLYRFRQKYFYAQENH